MVIALKLLNFDEMFVRSSCSKLHSETKNSAPQCYSGNILTGSFTNYCSQASSIIVHSGGVAVNEVLVMS